MAAKLGRNEPCWCGSGKKFKHCHLNREAETPLPFTAIAHATSKAKGYKTCLHPNASDRTCGHVISAHTLQRARVLSAIANSRNHVLSFYPPRPDNFGRFQLQEHGWRDASTFAAFCDKHDAQIFEPLEIGEFEATGEQCFLVAYRATCWELFRKICATKANTKVAELLDRGAPEHVQREIQHRLSIQQTGFEKGLQDLRALKALMDRDLLSGTFGGYQMQEFVFEAPMVVASTGSITPNRTLGGRSIQTLHDAAVETQWLAFGVDVSARGVSVVFIWNRESAAPNDYMKEIAALGDHQLPGFLIQFFFAHCENTYFADRWWKSLAQEDQAHIEKLMRNSNPYYFPPVYDLNRQLQMPRLLHVEALLVRYVSGY
jgi:hypothetical protein